ncbi:MAG: nucleotidyltransferase domain-containing protein [Defluviitaleaceae bacterium]|nr:nucleotidyltransferase domain-containing protein [Defluviitaleaceae bacterium]
MRKLELINVLIDIKSIVSKNPELVKRVGVFGSLAKGTFSDSSDIDIAVEYATTDEFEFSRFVSFCELCNSLMDYVANSYGRKVDLVHLDNRADGLIHDIKDEVVWI